MLANEQSVTGQQLSKLLVSRATQQRHQQPIAVGERTREGNDLYRGNCRMQTKPELVQNTISGRDL